MKRAASWIGILPLLISLPSQATIRHVPNPYTRINDGILAAAAGDTVLVDPGTYAESISFLGKAILVGSRYVTTGDTSYVSQTVIDCSGIPNASVARFVSVETRTSILSGLTLRGGVAASGGGVFCNLTSPTLDHLRVVHNTSINTGGGISVYGGGPLVTDCWITDNVAQTNPGDGGGIWAQYSDLVIQRCTIQRNHSDYRGGGIYCEDCYQTITGCTITNNLASRYNGGGMTSRNCAPLIAGNYIANNHSVWGGGMFY